MMRCLTIVRFLRQIGGTPQLFLRMDYSSFWKRNEGSHDDSTASCGLGLSVYPPSSCSCVYLPALLFELIAVVAFVSDLFALPFTLGEMEY